MSPWAVKRVNLRHENTEYSARLEAEAKVLRTLSHPHIIGYRGFEKTDAGQFTSVHLLFLKINHLFLSQFHIHICNRKYDAKEFINKKLPFSPLFCCKVVLMGFPKNKLKGQQFVQAIFFNFDYDTYR